MYKKRGDITRCNSSKKAQVTIFIIVGIVVFLIFMLMFQLVADVNKRELQENKGEVLGKIFTKSALKLYVDECLQEGMKEGLELLGRQGRIWTDQPGGRILFEDSKNGKELQGDKIFYSITDDRGKFNNENAYPCTEENGDYEFCKYSFPQPDVKFGGVALDKRFIQADLQRFLKEHTVGCVEEFVASEIQGATDIETPATMNLWVKLTDNIIRVKVNYPLRLIANEREFFHISRFDFTYSSQFKQLLDTVIEFPLEQEQNFVDFNLTIETLQGDLFTFARKDQGLNCVPEGEHFLCTRSTKSDKHGSLSIRMEKVDGGDGDDLFIFTVPREKIITRGVGDYFFRVLRQNRPPALNYVHRAECTDTDTPWDYLVVQGDDTFGDINIKLFSIDPDEDDNAGDVEITYEVAGDLPGLPLEQNEYVVPKTDVSGLTPNNYIIRASVNDGEDEDFQEIRIKIDKPLDTDIKLYNPYTGLESEKVSNGIHYAISREDPHFVVMENVASPTTFDSSRDLSLQYSSTLLSTPFGNRFPHNPNDGKKCFSFPFEGQAIDCNQQPPVDLSSYEQFIGDWGFVDQIQNPLTGKFKPDRGKYTLTAGALYCEGDNQIEEFVTASEAPVEVKGCYPHVNPEHPFAYPYHGMKELTIDPPYTGYIKNFEHQEINPFLSTHSCCEGDVDNPTTWKVKENTEECVRFPECSNLNNVNGFIPGYVLTDKISYCDGIRGNKCGGIVRTVPFESTYEPFKNFFICGWEEGMNDKAPGGQGYNGCSSMIAENCQGVPQFLAHVVQRNPVWCHGKMGCEKECREGAVFTGTEQEFSELPSPEPLYYTKLAKKYYDDENKIPTDSDLKLKCGCLPSDEGKHCDLNYDGNFQGRCFGGVCTDSSSITVRDCVPSDWNCELTECLNNKQENICTPPPPEICINPNNVMPGNIGERPCTSQPSECVRFEIINENNCICESPFIPVDDGQGENICDLRDCSDNENQLDDNGDQQCVCRSPLTKLENGNCVNELPNCGVDNLVTLECQCNDVRNDGTCGG
jgi:hypothetical protein